MTLFLHFLVYFETYGCQMNVNDTEVAWSILKDAGYRLASSPTEVSPLVTTVECEEFVGIHNVNIVWLSLGKFEGDFPSVCLCAGCTHFMGFLM